MIDAQFKSKQNQFLHFDTDKILSSPLYILLGRYLSHVVLLNLFFTFHHLDFLIFKEMFVDYKIMKGKTNQEDLSDLLCVSAIKN